MSSITKNRTPWILVVSSMILLFLFVGYWNVSSYLREKQKLSEDVEIQLQLAFTEIKDSELVYFIKTHLKEDMEGSEVFDSISIFFDESPLSPPGKIDFQSKVFKDINLSDSDRDTTVIVGIEIDTNLISNLNSDVTGTEVTIVATSNVNSLSRIGLENEIDTNNSDLKIQKVNINSNPKIAKTEFRFIQDTCRFETWQNLNDSIPSRYDSLYSHNDFLSPLRFFDGTKNATQTSVDKTYALFETKLKENKLPHDFSIISHPEQKIDGMKVTYESNGFGFKEWNVDLQNYQLFILKKMFPTLLFSVFLLGIITLAFWTLLKNWTREKRLALVKNEFINNMTHELKTPIATVGVALEAISNFDLSKEGEKTKEYLEMSRSEINRLSLLVDKVLNIAAFDSDNSTYNLENVNLKVLLTENINALKLQMEQVGAQLHFADKTENPIVKGDALHLSNVFHNMIDNAIKYSNENPIINISLTDDQDKFIISFEDNGLGIPKAYQEKIFDRFFRVPTNDKHDVKGHGLGLNYVKNVLTAHGGSISVSSTENEGSTFTISLPKKKIDV